MPFQVMNCILHEHELRSSESQVLTEFCFSQTALGVCVSCHCQPYFVLSFCYFLIACRDVIRGIILDSGRVGWTPPLVNLFLARRQCVRVHAVKEKHLSYINTKLGTRITHIGLLYDRTSACIDAEVKRSKVKVRR